MAAYARHVGSTSTKLNTLRIMFERSNPGLEGTFYECDNQFGIWVEDGIGKASGQAYFVWPNDGECMKHPIKLEKIADGFLSNTYKFTSPCKFAYDVQFHKIQLFPEVSIHLSMKKVTHDVVRPLVFNYISEHEHPDNIEKTECVTFSADTPLVDEDADKIVLLDYLRENVTSAYVISPDRKFAVIGNLGVGLILVHSTNGEINVYDYASYGVCDEKDTKIPACHPWFNNAVHRFSHPAIDSENATLYCKQFNVFDMPVYSKYTFKLLPKF